MAQIQVNLEAVKTILNNDFQSVKDQFQTDLETVHDEIKSVLGTNAFAGTSAKNFEQEWDNFQSQFKGYLDKIQNDGIAKASAVASAYQSAEGVN